MVNPQLLQFIKDAQDQDLSIDEIERRLITEGGWSKSDVAEGFSALGLKQKSAQPPVQTTPAPIQKPSLTVNLQQRVVPPPQSVVKPIVQTPIQRPTPPPVVQRVAPQPVVEQKPIEKTFSSNKGSLQDIDFGLTSTRQASKVEPKSTFIPPTKKIEQVSPQPPKVQPPVESYKTTSYNDIPKPPVQPMPELQRTVPIPQPVPVSEPVLPIIQKSRQTNTPPLPTVPPVKTFNMSTGVNSAPISKSSKSILWFFMWIIIVLLISGSVVYVYVTYFSKSNPPSVSQNNTNQQNAVNTPQVPVVPVNTQVTVQRITNSDYSYILPSDWQLTATSTGVGILASNKSKGYTLSAAITPIPKTAGDISSVDQIINSNTVNKIIGGEFPGSTLNDLASSTLDGEKSVTITFFGKSGSKPLAMTQYSAVHGSSLYSLVFIVDMSIASSPISPDFANIANSFEFK